LHEARRLLPDEGGDIDLGALPQVNLSAVDAVIKQWKRDGVSDELCSYFREDMRYYRSQSRRTGGQARAKHARREKRGTFQSSELREFYASILQQSDK
jgi:hypothetical protein